MTTTTVIAKDTSTAMEDIISQLGEDAIILSTNQKHGKVEMTATTDISSKIPKRLKPSQQFSRIFESRMLSEEILETKKPFELTEAINETNGASTAQLSALRHELKDIRNLLKGVVVTEPQNLNDNLKSSTALKLRQMGFSPKIVNTLEGSFVGKDFENGRVGFLRALANKIVPENMQNLKEAKIIYVIGASGNGSTTLAAKFAALFAEKSENITNKVGLAELDNGINMVSESLRGYGRLLNLKTFLLESKKAPTFHKDVSQIIVDVSNGYDSAHENIDLARKLYGNKNVAVVLSLPGGSSKRLIKMLWSETEDLKPVIALTKLDECEMGPEEFSEIAELDACISVITGTNAIVGTLAMASENVMTQYLKENC